MPEFTQDWTSHAIPAWERVLAPFRERNARILEIGSWEGRSAIWFLDFVPHATIVCIDIWGGDDKSMEPYTGWADMQAVERRFDQNLEPYEHRVRKLKQTSRSALIELGLMQARFDLIYVDGSHTAADTYADAVLAWPMLVPGGVMIFDDYQWTAMPNEIDRPKLGIDAFLATHNHELVVLHHGYQVIIEKARRP